MRPAAPFGRHNLAVRDEERPSGPLFRLSLLRGFELTRGGIAVPLSNGPQHLLAYLALQERALPRTYVAGVLWTNVTDTRASANLRSALWRLRQPGLDLVDGVRNSIRLSPHVAVDVRQVAAIARRLLNPAEEADDVDLEAIAFAGELLPGWYEDWLTLERERQRQICLHALETLCERWTSAHNFGKAVMAGLAAVASEPLRESAHRALIKAHVAEGNPGEAIRQYAIYRQTLRNELNLEPSSQMTDLIAGWLPRGNDWVTVAADTAVHVPTTPIRRAARQRLP